jgi:hypothetical protein
MLLDLNALSPWEWETYRELGQCFDPGEALAQAGRTLDALTGSVTVGMRRQDFLHEDEATLRAARDQLAFLQRGGDPYPDPEAVPVLAGIVITIAREAERAAKEHAGVAHRGLEGIADLIMITHAFMIAAKPREGFERTPTEVRSLEEWAALTAGQDLRRQALRELRRARQRARHEPTPSRVVNRKAAPYRDAPSRGASPREGGFRVPTHQEVRIAWENYRDICEREAREQATIDDALAAEDAERLARKEAELRVGPAISIPEWMFAAAQKRAAEAEVRRRGEGAPRPAPVGRRWHAPALTIAAAQGSYDAGYAWLVRAARETPSESAVDTMALRLADLLEEVALAGLRRTRKARGSGEMDAEVGKWPASVVTSFLSSHRPSPAARRRLDEGIALVDEVMGTGVRYLGYNGSTDFDCIENVNDDYLALASFL